MLGETQLSFQCAFDFYFLLPAQLIFIKGCDQKLALKQNETEKVMDCIALQQDVCATVYW